MAIEQIDASEWPVGNNSPLLVIALEPDDLSERFGLVFADGEDDLGPLKIAVVKSSRFGVAGLIRYVESPFRGTVVYVDWDSDIRETCEAVLQDFGLTEADVDQIATNLKPTDM